MTGVVYEVQPQPWEEANTRWLGAGALRIGVEYREVDPDALTATYGDDAEAMAEIEEYSPEGGFVDEGVSIHVCAAGSGHEHLRFDVFDGEPHYHYVTPSGDHNNVVEFDPVANGDMLPWVIERLRSRLTEMLALAGAGPDVVDQLDQVRVDRAIDEVSTLATEAQAAQRRARARGGKVTP